LWRETLYDKLIDIIEWHVLVRRLTISRSMMTACSSRVRPGVQLNLDGRKGRRPMSITPRTGKPGRDTKLSGTTLWNVTAEPRGTKIQ